MLVKRPGLKGPSRKKGKVMKKASLCRQKMLHTGMKAEATNLQGGLAGSEGRMPGGGAPDSGTVVCAPDDSTLMRR